MRTDTGACCRPLTRVGCLWGLALVLGTGCDAEDPATQTDSDAAMIIPTQPGAVLDAAQVPVADTGVPSVIDAAPGSSDAGRLLDATAPATDAGRSPDTGTLPPRVDASTPVTDAQVPSSNAEVCARWKAERADLKEGTWSGSVDTCTVGELSQNGLDNALRVFNLYRSLVGLKTFTLDAEANRKAQACAMLMAANGTITHTPPTTWKCYTAEAAAIANSSSLATGPSVSSVDGYVLDPGNATTLGHRRWVFSSYLVSVGFGSAGRYSCQYQPPGQGGGGGGKPWIAWPPPGQIPFQVFKGAWGGTLDSIGWSIQSDTVNFASAQVTVTSGGRTLAMTLSQLASGYGSRYAMRMVPMGWTTAAGEKYDVSITGISTPINYSVEVVNCAP